MRSWRFSERLKSCSGGNAQTRLRRSPAAPHTGTPHGPHVLPQRIPHLRSPHPPALSPRPPHVPSPLCPHVPIPVPEDPTSRPHPVPTPGAPTSTPTSHPRGCSVLCPPPARSAPSHRIPVAVPGAQQRCDITEVAAEAPFVRPPREAHGDDPLRHIAQLRGGGRGGQPGVMGSWGACMGSRGYGVIGTWSPAPGWGGAGDVGARGWGPRDSESDSARRAPPQPTSPPTAPGQGAVLPEGAEMQVAILGGTQCSNSHPDPTATPTPPQPHPDPNRTPTPIPIPPQPELHPSPTRPPPLTGFSPCLAGAVFLRCGAHRAQGVLLGAPALLWGRGGSRGGSQPHNLPAREGAEGGTGMSPAGAERSLRLYRENLAPWQDPSPTEGPQPHKWDPSSIVNPSPVTETKAA